MYKQFQGVEVFHSVKQLCQVGKNNIRITLYMQGERDVRQVLAWRDRLLLNFSKDLIVLEEEVLLA